MIATTNEDKKELPWWLRSSANPTRIATTLKGFSGVIVGFGALWGLSFATGDLNAIFDAFATFMASATAVIASGFTLFGLARKFYIKARK